MRKVMVLLMVLALTFSTSRTIYAQSTEVPMEESRIICADDARAYYGVKCVGCGRDDCMQYIGYEQVGTGGTTHRMYYKCTNCGAVTFVTMHAR